ncbi:MAG TPA: hypothetical protein VFQ85_01055 [Mycobacteriales bacterium]|jgi:hypothetical protein|nr:hypothetical protein [Mycobacteriales bacterium]
MSENDTTTTAEDLHAGGDKPGGDYGDVSGIGTADEDEGRAGSGGTPDTDEATRAQEGVQAAFETGIS